MMGHGKIVAVIGIIASVLILVFMPQIKWLAGITIGVVLIHVALLLVLSLSLAVVLPAKLKERLAGMIHNKKDKQEFDAGWSIGWQNGF